MVDSAGKKLAAAREAKGLSLDEAAHATKVRPDKLAALEQDDFSAFPNNTYARSFLLLYGRYLGVEVGELARSLETGNPISVQDYQYLNAQPDRELDIRRARGHTREPQNRRPSLVPLFVFLILLVGAGFGIHLFVNAQRLGNLDRKSAVTRDGDSVAATPPPGAVPAAKPVQPEAAAEPSPAPAAAPAAPPVELPAPDSSRILSDRDFINRSPAPATDATGEPAEVSTVSELAIEPAKKSWVTVRKDDPASEPIFEDYLYPNAGILKVKGRKFFIQVRGDGEVTIRKDGQPLAYQAPGISVQ